MHSSEISVLYKEKYLTMVHNDILVDIQNKCLRSSVYIAKTYWKGSIEIATKEKLSLFGTK